MKLKGCQQRLGNHHLPRNGNNGSVQAKVIQYCEPNKTFFQSLRKVCLCLLFFKFVSIDSKMNIKAYLKPHCGWSMGVRAIMDKYTLEYEDLDIINNQNLYAEMVEKSGQPLSPCVEIDGVMLADASGEEVENYMLSNKLVESTDKQACFYQFTLSGRSARTS